MLTFIETSKLPRKTTAQGEVTEILSPELCGAKSVLAALRALKPGQKFEAEKSNKHQLIYLMEGNGTISLENKNYEVMKGAGVYLGPHETVTIQPTAGSSLKLLHLTVAQIPV